MSAPRARRVAILCVNPWDSIVAEFQPFSYPAYRIQASLVADPRLADVEVRLFDGRDWTVDQWVEAVEAFDPDVIGGSAYVWSLPIFVPVFRQLAANRPDRSCVLGGPAARIEMVEHGPFRDTLQFVDALVLGMGEGTMSELVLAWPGSVHEIEGLAIPDGDGWRLTPPLSRRVPTSEIASPFQLELAPRNVSAHLQTFQGCPMSCSFCAWGVDNGESGIYSADYLERELRAFKAMNANAVMSVDAGLNLNSHAWRNLMEAEGRVGFLSEVPFHVECYPSRVTDEMVEFFRGLKLAEVGIGLQSYDPEVTRQSDRRYRIRNFERVVERVGAVSHLKIELILGLPGDDPQTFRRSVERAMALPCNMVQVYYCLVLPDALMRTATQQGLVYDPISLQLISSPDWSREELERTAAWLDGIVAEHGGVATTQWPRQNTDRQLQGKMGHVPGAPMWILPNH